MPDFSGLLKAPAGQAPKPKALYPDNYPAVIKGWEILPAPAGKNYSAIIRFQLGITGWGANVPEDEKTVTMPTGVVTSIDLSKKQLRRDFYDSSLFRLDELIRSCGIEPNGRSYEEVLPELVGSQVIAEVKQYLNQNTNEFGNEIGNLVGEAGGK